MQITLERAVEGLVSYMEEQIRQMTDPLDKFKWSLGKGVLQNNPSGIVARLRPTLEMFGILSGNTVDLDAMKAALDMGFANVPRVPLFGWNFTAEDSNTLLAKMQ